MYILNTLSVIYKIAVTTKTTQNITCLAIHDPPALLKMLSCLFAFYIRKHNIILYNINIYRCYVGSTLIFNIV